MRSRVPLRMAEFTPVGEGFAQAKQQVVLHIRVGVFVDRDARGRVRAVDDRHTALHAALLDRMAYLYGDVVHALVIRVQGKFFGFHCVSSLRLF